MRLAIFDFDGTLFRSPEKPEWWPHEGFWGRPETLSPPLVPENPGADWWASGVVREAKRCIGDPDTYTCLLTGRVRKFEKRIRHLLGTQGLRFDDCFFASGSGTLPFKLATIETLVRKFPAVEVVEMWDDRSEHTGDFEAKIRSLGVRHDVHLIPKATREFEGGPEALAAAKVAARFLGQRQ